MSSHVCLLIKCLALSCPCRKFTFPNHGKIAIFVATFLSWDLTNFLLWKELLQKISMNVDVCCNKAMVLSKIDGSSKDSWYFCIKYNMGSFRTLIAEWFLILPTSVTLTCSWDNFLYNCRSVLQLNSYASSKYSQNINWPFYFNWHVPFPSMQLENIEFQIFLNTCLQSWIKTDMFIWIIRIACWIFE